MGSPGTPPEHHTVVTERDRIVCLKLRWIGRALLDGSLLVTDTGADFAAHPAYQGRGLGRLLTDFEVNGARPRGDIAMDLPPSNSVVQNNLHAAELHQHPLVSWSQPLTMRALASAHRGRPLRFLAASARAARRRMRPTAAPSTVAIQSIEQFDERADELWAASRDVADFVRVRDASYLYWRYADPRSGRRLILSATEGEQLLGWLVLRPGDAETRLIDILVDPQRPDAGTALLNEATRRARAAGAGSIAAWLSPGSALAPLMQSAGFAPAPDAITYELFEPRGGTGAPDLMRRLGDPDLRTHVTMGDFDFN
jgi:GNAT superfamily N-acetyltransferase